MNKCNVEGCDSALTKEIKVSFTMGEPMVKAVHLCEEHTLAVGGGGLPRFSMGSSLGGLQKGLDEKVRNMRWLLGTPSPYSAEDMAKAIDYVKNFRKPSLEYAYAIEQEAINLLDKVIGRENANKL